MRQRRYELTVKEYAEQERVSTRTVWSWIAKGAIKARRTPGGGVRLPDPTLKNSENQRNPSE